MFVSAVGFDCGKYFIRKFGILAPFLAGFGKTVAAAATTVNNNVNSVNSVNNVNGNNVVIVNKML